MINNDKNDSVFKWAVWLPLVTVLLPAVCLVWFMGQTMRNERLAIRQKLVDVYTENAEKAFGGHSKKLTAEMQFIAGKDAETLIRQMLTDETIGVDGFILLDEHGYQMYPFYEVEGLSVPDEEVQNAWKMEFEHHDYVLAADTYGEIADAGAAEFRLAALLGKARCLKKAGRLSEAVETYNGPAWFIGENLREHPFTAQARLLQLKLMQSLAHPKFFDTCTKTLQTGYLDLILPSQMRIFYLEQTLDIADKAGLFSRKWSNC